MSQGEIPSSQTVTLQISKTFQKFCILDIELYVYTPLAKLLARQARLGTTQDGSGNKAENYSSISATNHHQLRQKMYQ